MNIVLGGQTQAGLPVTMPAHIVTYTTANSVTVVGAGDYEVSYFLYVTAAAAAAITAAVRQNGTNIPSLEISRLLSAAVGSIYSGSSIVTLAAGSTLDIALSVLLAIGITLGSGVNAILAVKKLN